MFKGITKKYFQRFRIWNFKMLSDNENVKGSMSALQPVLLKGAGRIEFGKNVTLGYEPSPFFYQGAIHIEARESTSSIVIGDNVMSNNNLTIICARTEVHIEKDCLIGPNVTMFDTDFHGIHPNERRTQNFECSPIKIEENVFIGANCIILKGVTIGKNSIVASGSIVTRSVESNVIVGGNPAKFISNID